MRYINLAGKVITISILILISSVVFADITLISSDYSGFTAEVTSGKTQYAPPMQGEYTTCFFGMPYNASANVEIEVIEYSIASEQEIPQELRTPLALNASVDRLGDMRNIGVGRLYVPNYVLQKNSSNILKIERANIKVTFDRPFVETIHFLDSRIFDDIAHNIFLNYATIPRDIHNYAGSILFITPRFLYDDLQPLVKMRREMGYVCNVYVLEDEIDEDLESIDHNDVHAFLQEKYAELYPVVDITVIVGDTQFPSGGGFPDYVYRDAYYYASDHQYAIFDDGYTTLGTDFIPDVLISRLSVDEGSELQTVVERIRRYEMDPLAGDEDWVESALLVGSDRRADSPPLNLYWVRDLMSRAGVDEIDSLMDHDYDAVETEDITEAIEVGRGYVCYRGWGGTQGWHEPEYYVSDLLSVRNSTSHPLYSSIVCGTGDFAATIDPCFAEAVIRQGTPSSPRGGIAAYAPSDHDTHTHYNNVINFGFWESIFNYDMTQIGQAQVFSKLSEYLFIPIFVEDSVKHYFYVYNIMGDATTPIWRGTPNTFTLNAPDTVRRSGDVVEISVDPALEGVLVTFYKEVDGSQSTAYTKADGTCNLLIPAGESGHATITATLKDYLPVQQEVYVQFYGLSLLEVVNVEIDDHGDSDGRLDYGETANISVTLNNHGGTTGISTFYLGSENRALSISPFTPYHDIPTGEFTIEDFEVELNSPIITPDFEDESPFIRAYISVEKNEEIRYILPIEIPLSTGSLKLTDYVLSGTPSLTTPGELSFVLENRGDYSTPATTLHVKTLSAFYHMDEQYIEVPSVAAGASYTTDAIDIQSVTVENVCAEFWLEATEGFNLGSITIVPEGAGPTGPDKSGYLAFDQEDPTYPSDIEFNDISTHADVTNISTNDDRIHHVALPFTLYFYGEAYDTITICSNGWVSPGKCSPYLIDFQNLPIPMAGGPYGLIAPFWDDLAPSTTGIKTLYDTDEDAFIIQWYNFVNRRGSGTYNFELVIYNNDDASVNNSDLAFLYVSAPEADDTRFYSTVGIEAPDHMKGLEYKYCNIYDNNAIEFETNFGIFFTTKTGGAKLFGDVTPPQAFVYNENGQFAQNFHGEYKFAQIASGDITVYGEAKGYFIKADDLTLDANTRTAHDINLEIIPVPTLTSVAPHDSENGRVITWTAPDAGSHTIDGYKIYRRFGTAGSFHYVGETTETTYFDPSEFHGDLWYYYVTVIMDDRESFPSNKMCGPSGIHNVDETTLMPFAFGITEVSPNPFNSSSVITVVVPEDASNAKLDILDVSGRVIKNYSLSGSQNTYNIRVDIDNMPTGVYFASFSSSSANSNVIKTRKLLLMK